MRGPLSSAILSQQRSPPDLTTPAPVAAGRAYKDFAAFLTATLVASAAALPLVLAHTGQIAPGACWMSLGGGALVYGTILVFSGTFVRLPFRSLSR